MFFQRVFASISAFLIALAFLFFGGNAVAQDGCPGSYNCPVDSYILKIFSSDSVVRSSNDDADKNSTIPGLNIQEESRSNNSLETLLPDDEMYGLVRVKTKITEVPKSLYDRNFLDSIRRVFGKQSEGIILSVEIGTGVIKFPEAVLLKYNLSDDELPDDRAYQHNELVYSPVFRLSANTAPSFTIKFGGEKRFESQVGEIAEFLGPIISTASGGLVASSFNSTFIEAEKNRIDSIISARFGRRINADSSKFLNIFDEDAKIFSRTYSISYQEEKFADVEITLLARRSISDGNLNFDGTDWKTQKTFNDGINSAASFRLYDKSGDPMPFFKAVEGDDELRLINLSGDIDPTQMNKNCTEISIRLKEEFGLTELDAAMGLAAILNRNGKERFARDASLGCISPSNIGELVKRKIVSPRKASMDEAHKNFLGAYLKGEDENFSKVTGYFSDELFLVDSTNTLMSNGLGYRADILQGIRNLGISEFFAYAPGDSGSTHAHFYIPKTPCKIYKLDMARTASTAQSINLITISEADPGYVDIAAKRLEKMMSACKV